MKWTTKGHSQNLCADVFRSGEPWLNGMYAGMTLNGRVEGVSSVLKERSKSEDPQRSAVTRTWLVFCSDQGHRAFVDEWDDIVFPEDIDLSLRILDREEHVVWYTKQMSKATSRKDPSPRQAPHCPSRRILERNHHRFEHRVQRRYARRDNDLDHKHLWWNTNTWALCPASVRENTGKRGFYSAHWEIYRRSESEWVGASKKELTECKQQYEYDHEWMDTSRHDGIYQIDWNRCSSSSWSGSWISSSNSVDDNGRCWFEYFAGEEHWKENSAKGWDGIWEMTTLLCSSSCRMFDFFRRQESTAVRIRR